MNNIIRRVFNKFESRWSRTRLNLIATFYLNFRTLPFSQACKFPLYVYGKVKFYKLSGEIIINAPLKKGMIKFGIPQGFFTAPKGGAMFLLDSGTKLIFNGPCKFDCDYVIRITEGGVVNIGAFTGFGSDIKICAEKSITIGEYCRIPFGTCFMDTNFHYTINTESGTVHTKKAPIVIGKYNWIGNTTTVMKGTRTPDGAIIASKSFLNKDFIKLSNGAVNIVIAGAPAKIMSENSTRVLSFGMQQKLNEWFREHPDEVVYQNEILLSSYRDTSLYDKLFN